MSQGPLCPNLTKKVQKEVSQMANHNLLHRHLNHLKTGYNYMNIILYYFTKKNSHKLEIPIIFHYHVDQCYQNVQILVQMT